MYEFNRPVALHYFQKVFELILPSFQQRKVINIAAVSNWVSSTYENWNNLFAYTCNFNIQKLKVCRTGRLAECLNFVSLACEAYVNKIFLCIFCDYSVWCGLKGFWKAHKIVQRVHERNLKPNLIKVVTQIVKALFFCVRKARENFSLNGIQMFNKQSEEFAPYGSICKLSSGKECFILFSTETTAYFIKEHGNRRLWRDIELYILLKARTMVIDWI